VTRHLWALRATASLFVVLILAVVTRAADPPSGSQQDLNRATTTVAARQDAIDAIPTERLTPAGRARVAWVLENTSVFRRLPVRITVCDPGLYQFLVHHPDVVVNIWEQFGVSHLALRQMGPDTYQVTDDVGTSGTIQFLYRSRDTNVAYIDGQYTGRLLGHQVRGRGILVLKSGFVRNLEGKCYVTSRLDAFMNIEPGGAEFLTKTFQPLVGKVADQNFIQTADFLGSLSRTAEVNGRGMLRLAARLERIQPEVRQEFARLLEQVAQRTGRANRPAWEDEEDGLAGASDRVEPLVARRPNEAASPAVSPTTPSPTPAP